MKWTPENIAVGAVLTKPCGDKFYMPTMIGWRHQTEGDNIYGLVDLRDGMFMQFGDGSKVALAEHLNASEHIPAIKMRSKGAVEIASVENRMSLPIVAFHNVGQR